MWEMLLQFVNQKEGGNRQCMQSSDFIIEKTMLITMKAVGFPLHGPSSRRLSIFCHREFPVTQPPPPPYAFHRKAVDFLAIDMGDFLLDQKAGGLTGDLRKQGDS